jgi:hypothetical protein
MHVAYDFGKHTHVLKNERVWTFCITLALRAHSTFKLHSLELFSRFILRNDDYALGKLFLGKRVKDFEKGYFKAVFD